MVISFSILPSPLSLTRHAKFHLLFHEALSNQSARLVLLLLPGEALWQWGFLTITKEGIRQAIFMGTRLLLLVSLTSILTLTTTPISLTDGIENLLKPFQRFGMPAHELAMMMTIALRFIPIFQCFQTCTILSAMIAARFHSHCQLICPFKSVDRGVHALGQVVNFYTESLIPVEKLARAINQHLPEIHFRIHQR